MKTEHPLSRRRRYISERYRPCENSVCELC